MESCLIVICGLPATGKTTVARLIVEDLKAAYLRVDTIETAIARAQHRRTLITGGEGYEVAYHLAADQLRLSLDVVVECVNPIQVTREAWLEVARRCNVKLLEVELVCSDLEEHRHRLENRTLDVVGMRNPSWQEVQDREYEPWHRKHLQLDTARLRPSESAERIITHMSRLGVF
ncbi:AAA family ATPase [Actinomyces trachealis]|uniref:AAA family ATPase n=1 Tax=Actinomyces trachealis TaxID=2763540 RepID=UPI001892995A|nr:AAA family ATPase [Actinomyces trachealis]